MLLRPVPPRARRASWLAAALLTASVLGCTGDATPDRPAENGAAEAAAPAASSRPVRPLGPLTTRVRADVLVISGRPLAAQQLARLRALAPGGSATLRVGTVTIRGQRLLAAGVDPASFRAFTPEGTAESTPVWQSVARGEVAVAHERATALKLGLGQRVDVAASAKRTLRLGALATPAMADLSVVLADDVAAGLGLPAASGMVLSARSGQDPAVLARAVREAVGGGTRVDLLTEPAALPMAFLQGGRAAKRLGGFSYTVLPDGSIEPDAAWVRANIRYATVPVIGTVRCHKLMIPQLKAALAEIQRAGLGPKLYSFAGCYVPRFIERDPDQPISLHSWGIAVDFNVATNMVGTRGDMDPRIVAIFEKWGFRWGGRWKVPDPMHFELAALLAT